MLFWALMASGQITMRRVDGWQTLDQAPGQVLEQPFGLVGIVLVPGLAQRFLDARVQMLGQALDDVVDLAALDGDGRPEGVADRFAERLRSIDDEQPDSMRHPIGARRHPFAPLSGQVAAQNGKIRPLKPREPNKSIKPQNPPREIIQTHRPITRTKQ